MPTEDNKFVDRLYQDFEQKLFKVFGFGIQGLRIAIDLPESEARPRHSVDDRLNEAFKRGGTPQLRWQMNNEIACLEYLRMSNKMGREANYDEWAEHILSLNIGMTKEELIPFDEEELPNFVEEK